jgi:ankyrin repeat protein
MGECFQRLFASADTGFPAAHVAHCHGRTDVVKAILQESDNTDVEVDILKRGITHLYAESDVTKTNIVDHPPDVPDIYSLRPLAIAAKSGNLEYFKSLANLKHDLNSIALEDRSILSIAAGAGHTDIVEFMLQNKVNPNPDFRIPRSAYSALHAAAASGHIEVIKLLLKHNALAGCISNDQRPSEEARNYGHREAAKLLEEAEAAQERDLQEAKLSEVKPGAIRSDSVGLSVIDTGRPRMSPGLDGTTPMGSPAAMYARKRQRLDLQETARSIRSGTM